MSKRLLSRTALIIGASLFPLLFAGQALADIEISQRGKIVRLNVTNAPIAEVIGELAERFDFVVEGAPEHWSPEAIDFQASGELEAVLGSLLKDTSHVYAYHTDPVTRKPQIAAVKLLNRGKAAIAGRPGPARSGATTGSSALRTTRAIGTGLHGVDGVEHTVEVDGAIPARSSANARRSTQLAGSGSSLSNALEQRARMTAATNTAADGSQAATPQRNNVELSGDAQADMQALTRRALQDVQNLADALRQAEATE